MVSDPTYPLFSVLSFIGFIVALIPLSWHLEAWNAGTCLYMFWTSIGCLNLFINSIVWRDNAINSAPIWCDISTRIIVGISVALPASSLCINRRLYKIANVQSVSISRAEKRRAVLEDLSIGLGIPILQMGLQIIVEGHRFDIFEEIGCFPATFNTPIAYPLSIAWPIAIGLVSAVYSILAIRAFLIRRSEFSQFLSANSAFTVNRYFRLMALAATELLFNTPICAYGIYLNVKSHTMQPWRGWADAHFDYFTVDLSPSLLWRQNHEAIVSLELNRWSMVFCALLFFAFFGFADEARRRYRIVFSPIIRRIGRFSPAKGDKHSTITSKTDTLPTYVKPLRLASLHESPILTSPPSYLATFPSKPDDCFTGEYKCETPTSSSSLPPSPSSSHFYPTTHTHAV